VIALHNRRLVLLPAMVAAFCNTERITPRI